MPTNCSNWLTSTCLTFVSYRSVRKRSAQQRCGSDYYPQTNDGKLVLVASSIQRSNKNLRYIVNRNFIICYSMMFCLGTIFAWDVCGQFKYWLESLINCTPRYIQPHMRAINQLAPQTQHEGNPVQYNWSTTEPVEHPNAPPNWDSNQVLANVTGCKFQLNPLFTTTNT
ncbi:hypothetical protein RHMOL_Rhmol11G0097700 [Rhododendron molle]|uniref:Uncharacterized protein n=1 Tax=Rhododendron molle TaxID=49168 RepID=A0ACC0LQJ2_RHOML|nr:hypothetical protein RHMOL_Rhmol11G0097700 [Rhododendron molle]